MKKQILIGIAFLAILMLISKKLRSMMQGYLGFVNPFKSETSSVIYLEGLKAGLGSVMSRLLVAWSKHETGNYKSNFARNYKAMFGYMRDANSKHQTGGGTNADNGAKIGAYNGNGRTDREAVAHSTREVIDWLNRRDKKDDRGNFPDPASIDSPVLLARLLKQAGYYQGPEKTYAAALEKFYASND